MKIKNSVKNFFMKFFANSNIPSELKPLIDADVKTFDDSITEKILSRKMRLDWSWASYELSDIDIYYDDITIRLGDRLEMFGIRDDAPAIRPGDTGLTIVYRFTVSDIYGTEVDIVTGIRVSVMRPSGGVDTQRIVLYG